MNYIEQLTLLANLYAAATGNSITTIGTKFCDQRGFYKRMTEPRQNGKPRSITEDRAQVIIGRFSKAWPENTEWPSAVRRPADSDFSENSAPPNTTFAQVALQDKEITGNCPQAKSTEIPAA